MSTAIEFENISKQYRLGLVSTGTLSHDLNRFGQTKILHRPPPTSKYAKQTTAYTSLQRIRMSIQGPQLIYVKQGNIIVIIGRNGSGKSMLFSTSSIFINKKTIPY